MNLPNAEGVVDLCASRNRWMLRHSYSPLSLRSQPMRRATMRPAVLLSMAFAAVVVPTPSMGQQARSAPESRPDSVVAHIHVARDLARWGVTRSKVLNAVRFALDGAGVSVVDNSANSISASVTALIGGCPSSSDPNLSDVGRVVTWRASASFAVMGSTDVSAIQQIEGRSLTTDWAGEAMQAIQTVLLSVVNEYVSRR